VSPDADHGLAPAPAAPEELDALIFKACVVALWSDGEMAAAERNYVSHLIDSIAATEAQRAEMRRIALHDVSGHAVLAELERFDQPARRQLFDRCFELLASDRRLGRGELRFLSEIRRRCGVGWWSFERSVWRVAWRRRVAALITLVVLCVAAIVAATLWRVPPPGVAPQELQVHEEIALRATPEARVALPPEQLYEAVRHSVVTVNVLISGTLQGNGSGAVIGWDRLGQLYILTNRHVVLHELPEGDSLGLEAELESGVQLPALLDFFSRRRDLALLVVPGLTGWAEPLPVVPRRQLRVGQQVYAVGSPIGLRHSFTSGVISALRGDYIQTDATVHQGSSGGPLIDVSGGVCGIVSQTHSAKDFTFAIYADTVVDLLEERRTRPAAAE
jgi:Trypsin-like peptidase domain